MVTRAGTAASDMGVHNPIADAERIAQLVMQEAKTSLPKAGRLIVKLIGVAVLGFLLASSCCLSGYLVPVGVVILAIAAGWLDAIGQECMRHCFFPNKSLNSMGAHLFRWHWVVVWTCILFGLSCTGAVPSLRFAFVDRLRIVLTLVVVPLVLMLLGRTAGPYHFRRARADIRKAELLVRQVMEAQNKTPDSSTRGGLTLAPFIEPEKIPLYKLGSVAKLLYTFVASYGVEQKLTVELPPVSDTSSSMWLSIVYSPFRTIASDLFLWESRDLVLITVGTLYFLMVYVGSFYFPLSPLFVAVPFMGPKSRVGRYLRDMQNDIRLAQGVSVQKKGGMTPEGWTIAKKLDFASVNWPMATYLVSIHLVALYALVVITVFGGVCPIFGDGAAIKRETWISTGVFYLGGALGITAGVHRLWSHRSYKAGLPLRFFLMIMNSIANQGCIFHWARDHRVHHLYSDTVADPHDSSRGFWFSHVGWLLFKKHPAVLEAGKKLSLDDLYADPIVMFQAKADPFWNLLLCFAFPSFLALAWGDSVWNGFLLAGVLRYVALLNATWCVNSVVHCWGTKPYNSAHCTTENGWVSIFAIGEGWHNWHHAFDWDYAAAELGALSQFNPTKVFIDAMAFLGLAWGRKRALEVWDVRKARWAKSAGRSVVESLEGPPLFKRRIITFGPAPYGEEHEAVDADGCADVAKEQ